MQPVFFALCAASVSFQGRAASLHRVVALPGRRPLSASSLAVAQPLTRVPSAKLSTIRLTGDKVVAESGVDPSALRESLAFRRASWFSWWAQLILSVVSTITLVFANAARQSSNPFSSGLLFASGGVIMGFVSTFWMWGYKGFSRRLRRPEVDLELLATKARRSLRLGIGINIIGMAITLLSMEQIIGQLAAKALTMGLSPAAGMFVSGLANAIQPIDLLVLQANTNTLVSLYVGLCTSLWLRQRRFVNTAAKS
mmetsp:Transcript_14830/g.43592  ORF Transcript_14830/g.43592 Transcript_14830/m.43592 type:complete len:254 (-) Transcript_14830:268-1029(-)|eukprot:CAMPEP_0206049866 /NCGR_PEP_ID=MMETSP1466-20131121/27737_1 /ASSEMBLY_ACC=CAM_ASM_001126 /TAXON_ID=44452 /ORGANISM="Pavlova gyrans, Strain CCMP608" /LENGTH=253 /DNA_ID=CAMNT_0053424965 /DNA_START=25 /DNA_END=786 /DNA_ORIENTATION=-